MKVKDRLSFQFTFLFAILLLIVLMGIYLFVEHNRVKSFYNKLDDRSLIIAQFYLAEDNLSKETFKDVLKKFPQSLTDESINIYDEQFMPKFVPEDPIHWPRDVLKKVSQKNRIHLYKKNVLTSGLFYKDNSGNFIVMVSAIDESGNKDMYQLRWIVTFFFLASLSITFLMGRLFSRIALLPILKITDNLKIIRSSNLNERLNINTSKTDEIDILKITINQFLERLEQSFLSQKSFITHASHELRTPITTILGEAEIALMKDRNNESYKNTLQNIVKEAEGLSLIVNGLMDMIQTNLDNIEFNDLKIDELLWEISDELLNQNGPLDIKYDLTADHPKYVLQGNRQLLFIAISNIIKNALKFSNNKKIVCKIVHTSKGLNIHVIDYGIGIDQNEIEKIFDPFFRASNSFDYPGSGIGLALSQNIIKLHNGTIEVHSALNVGSEFHIFLPTYVLSNQPQKLKH